MLILHYIVKCKKIYVLAIANFIYWMKYKWEDKKNVLFLVACWHALNRTFKLNIILKLN